MLRIGEREVIYDKTFIVLHGEEVHLSFNNEGINAKFRIRFLEDSADKNAIAFDISPDPDEDDRGLITLTNWNQKNRVVTPEPISIMEFKEFDVWLLASAVYVDKKFIITMQFMKGEKE